MTIKAHCMGSEFPKRDTDNSDIIWESAVPTLGRSPILPSAAADLDAVAEKERAREQACGQQCKHCGRTDHALADDGNCWECWSEMNAEHKSKLSDEQARAVLEWIGKHPIQSVDLAEVVREMDEEEDKQRPQ